MKTPRRRKNDVSMAKYVICKMKNSEEKAIGGAKTESEALCMLQFIAEAVEKPLQFNENFYLFGKRAITGYFVELDKCTKIYIS